MMSFDSSSSLHVMDNEFCENIEDYFLLLFLYFISIEIEEEEKELTTSKDPCHLKIHVRDIISHEFNNKWFEKSGLTVSDYAKICSEARKKVYEYVR